MPSSANPTQSCVRWPSIPGPGRTSPWSLPRNRDEFYERPSEGPQALGPAGRAVGGRDLRAGGSWLALGRAGLVVGVLNRRSASEPDPRRLSRGSLCVELAEASCLDAALTALRAREVDAYNPFNLLLADRERAFVAQNRQGTLSLQQLTPGLHLLTNLDLNDATCQRISRSTHRFAALVERHSQSGDTASLVLGLRLVLADHQMPARRPAAHRSALHPHPRIRDAVLEFDSGRRSRSYPLPARTRPALSRTLPKGRDPLGGQTYCGSAMSGRPTA